LFTGYVDLTLLVITVPLLLALLLLVLKQTMQKQSSSLLLHSHTFRPRVPTTSHVRSNPRNPPNRKPSKARTRTTGPAAQTTVDTPLGPVSFRKARRPVAAIVVALGQSEDHLRWFYDVYRKGYLKRAVAKLRAVERGDRSPSEWNSDYFEFMQDSERQLENLEDERDAALRDNRLKIQTGEPAFLGAYETVAQARESARYSAKKREPTLNAGWLQVHVVEIHKA
jgi:hypothetical protein